MSDWFTRPYEEKFNRLIEDLETSGPTGHDSPERQAARVLRKILDYACRPGYVQAHILTMMDVALEREVS